METRVEHSKENLDFTIQRSAWVNERFIPEGEFDLHFEEFERNGFTILENRLSKEEIAHAKDTIDRVYDEQVKEMGGEADLIEIGEHGLARNLLQYDEFFLKLIAHPDVMAFGKHFLGEYFSLFQFNGNLNPPKLPATSTPWHRDLTFRHFTSSRPLGFTTIWVLDDFTQENDGVYYLPGTHKHDAFPSFEYVDKFQQKLFVKAGSAIVLDGMMFHRSGFNNTDHRRRICQGMYTLPFIGQQICIPETVSEKYKEDSVLRQLLGYNSMQQSSVIDWRKEKLENKRKNLQGNMVQY